MPHPLEILQIVPRLPPSISGVGDYAYLLARQLRLAHGITTRFIVCDTEGISYSEIDGFDVKELSGRTETELLATLGETDARVILLQYVGYGYQKRGCPVWLVRGLEEWKRCNPEARLITMFHEISAFGPPWTSAFWTSVLQRNIAARVARVSDACMTNRKLYADILKRLSRGVHEEIPWLPVFSNVGEPENVLPLKDRKRRVVVFGSAASRSRVYEKSMAALEKVCHSMRIEEVIDIGPTIRSVPSSVNGTRITQLGPIPGEQVSRVLLNSVIGVFDYNPAYLDKSTIFAAYCAHGVVTINAAGNAHDFEQWLTFDELEVSQCVPNSDLLADEVTPHGRHASYRAHSLSKHAISIARQVHIVTGA